MSTQGMTWAQVAARIESMPPNMRNQPASISCDPDDHDPEMGMRYLGTIQDIEDDGTNAVASFVGENNLNQ